MARYAKGASAERELTKILWEMGFAVARVAGSGKNVLPMPDIIAMGKEKKLAFECKAWNAAYLNIDINSMEEQKEWVRRAEAELVIAWKVPNKGFLFLRPEQLIKVKKSYAISRSKAMKESVPLEIVLGLQSKLPRQSKL